MSDPYFKREGYDIFTDSYISIPQAVLGDKMEVKTLYGNQTVTIKNGTQSGDRVKLSKMGVTKLAPYSHDKGDHYVTLKIKVPTKIDEKEAELYQQLSNLEKGVDQIQEPEKDSEKVQTEQTEKKSEKKEVEDEEGDHRETSGNKTFESILGKIKNPWAN